MNGKESPAMGQLLSLLEARYAMRVLWALKDGHGQTFRLLQDSVGGITPNTLNTRNTPETQTAVMMLRGKGVAVETGGHTKGFIEGSELVVVSPGVEDLSPAIVWANELNIPIISELELGYDVISMTILPIV